MRLRSQKRPLVLLSLFLVAIHVNPVVDENLERGQGRTGRSARGENVKDKDKANTADSVPSPLVPLSLIVVRTSNTSEKTSDDHEDIGKDR